MAFVTWLRALNAVGTVAEATRMFRGARGAAETSPTPVDPAAGFETRLANVVVAALKEAFDRDRARLDLERDSHEAAQARQDKGLRLEWLRQTATHALNQTRQLAVFSIVVWIASAGAAGWLAPLAATPRTLLGLGWIGLATALGAAFNAHHRLTDWLAQGASSTFQSSAPPAELPSFVAQTALPWLFLAGFVMTAVALVTALA